MGKRKLSNGNEDSGAVKGRKLDSIKSIGPDVAHLEDASDNKKSVFSGNYGRYYGYRLGKGNPALLRDPRVDCFKISWFKRKKCLDIGCNTGLVTLQIARELQPRYLVAIDVDRDLINRARSVVRKLEERRFATAAELRAPSKLPTDYPFNVVFKREDIISGQHQGFAYDVITCLSVTKWVHLQYGDEGIRALFRETYQLLQPGGHLILEPQPWKSYKKKYSLSEVTKENFHKIKLRPDQFPNFLVKEIGFKTMQKIEPPDAETKGFRRPIYVFTK